VARPTTCFYAHQEHDRDPFTRRELGTVLDPRHVLSQREAGAMAQGHRAKPNAHGERHRTYVVRQQVGLTRSRFNTPEHLCVLLFASLLFV